MLARIGSSDPDGENNVRSVRRGRTETATAIHHAHLPVLINATHPVIEHTAVSYVPSCRLTKLLDYRISDKSLLVQNAFIAT